MKGSSGAGWTAVFAVLLLILSWGDLPGGAKDYLGAVALAFLGLFFICRSIESLKEEA